jgi:hypothetical protein
LATPSNQQLERHIRQSSAESSNVAFVKHALDQMRARHVNLAVVAAVEYPQPGLTVVTVINITKG